MMQNKIDKITKIKMIKKDNNDIHGDDEIDN